MYNNREMGDSTARLHQKIIIALFENGIFRVKTLHNFIMYKFSVLIKKMNPNNGENLYIIRSN